MRSSSAAVALAAILFAIGACSSSPPAAVPTTKSKVQSMNNRTRYTINSIRHPSVAGLNFGTEILPSFTLANELWNKDDAPDTDPATANNDVSVAIDLYVSAPGTTLPAPWDAERYNRITSEEDLFALMAATDFDKWLIVVTSTPGNSLAWGSVNRARITVSRAGLFGDVIAHELGHNSGLQHRSFSWNGKTSILNPTVDPAHPGVACLANNDEKQKMENP